MKGRLRCFINLTVTWKNNKADHVVERTSLPDHLIRGAEGKLAFQDTQPRVMIVGGAGNVVMKSFYCLDGC